MRTLGAAAVVVEVTYLTWTEDNLLRQVSYQGQREDKPAPQVVRPYPPRREEQLVYSPRYCCRPLWLKGNTNPDLSLGENQK